MNVTENKKKTLKTPKMSNYTIYNSWGTEIFMWLACVSVCVWVCNTCWAVFRTVHSDDRNSYRRVLLNVTPNTRRPGKTFLNDRHVYTRRASVRTNIFPNRILHVFQWLYRNIIIRRRAVPCTRKAHSYQARTIQDFDVRGEVGYID